MTTNFELIKIAEELGLRNFRGIYMRVELRDLKTKDTALSEVQKDDNEYLILNLNDSSVTPQDNKQTGHWILLARVNGKSYHFCSYGSPPCKEAIDYLGKTILTHNFALQPFGTSICGELCLLIAHLLDNGVSYTDAVLGLYDLFT
jgi:hypothetical protein